MSSAMRAGTVWAAIYIPRHATVTVSDVRAPDHQPASTALITHRVIGLTSACATQAGQDLAAQSIPQPPTLCLETAILHVSAGVQAPPLWTAYDVLNTRIWICMAPVPATIFGLVLRAICTKVCHAMLDAPEGAAAVPTSTVLPVLLMRQ